MNDVRYYKVGGYVRDSILGIPSKDIDYSVEAQSYDAMKNDILKRGGVIFLEKPEYLTIRAKLNGIAADFVLCRKEGQYSDCRHPDSVEPGSIFDDLARRDFTVNAIAMDTAGNYIDPFNGLVDIKLKVIRCVGSTDRLIEDALRMLRAIRFAITKGFTLDPKICYFINAQPELIKNISQERVREELTRCFAHDTMATLNMLHGFPKLETIVWKDFDIWLKPTCEER